MKSSIGQPGLPGGSVVKNLPANAGDRLGWIPGSGRSPGGGYGNSLQYSRLGNSMDRGAWRATVYRVSKSWTLLKWLSARVYMGFPGGSAVRNLRANARDSRNSGLISGSGRSPGEGNDNPLQYSRLGNSMDREACRLQSKGLQRVIQDSVTKQQMCIYTHRFIGSVFIGR